MLVVQKSSSPHLASIPPHNPERFEKVGGLGNPKLTNGLRAGLARRALITFHSTCHMTEEMSVTASDLICDLLHLIHASGYNPATIVESAIEDFIAEAGEIP